jgi:hypothetical protein
MRREGGRRMIKLTIRENDKQAILEMDDFDPKYPYHLKLFQEVLLTFRSPKEKMKGIVKAYKEKYDPIELPVNPTTEEHLKFKGLTKENKQDDHPEWYKTGIKTKDGRNHYKCRYECPICDNKGNHYIPSNITGVNCHECDAKMDVYYAHDAGLPNRDEFGNYFIAGLLVKEDE